MALPIVIALCLGLASLQAQDDAHRVVRGMTVSTAGSGRDWGGEGMVSTLRELSALGANWVTTHPYGSISDGSRTRRGGQTEAGAVRGWSRDFGDGQPPAHLVRPITEAHALGMKVMIKPHLAYWGTRFSWRGEIVFHDDAEWDRFFDSYEEWIVDHARACRDADAFCVGTELDQTLQFEDRWRQIIAKVRKETDAHLTYAANWTDYERVPFWDALDVIGIQAYFPLSEVETSDAAQIRAGWQKRMETLRRFADHTGKDIVFTELGYNKSHEAAVRPWAYEVDHDELGEQTQETCLRAALRAMAQEPRVVGAFLWKWFPGERRQPRDFNMQETRIRNILAESWND